MLLSGLLPVVGRKRDPVSKDMTEVLLEEVVRCSERIVTGAMSFQIGGDNGKVRASTARKGRR